MLKLISILYVVLCIKHCNCMHARSTRPQLDGRIVGGCAVDIQEIPFQVSLQYGFHICGGSLLSKRYVLTAAHCTVGGAANHMRVRIGSTLTARGGVLVSVEQIFRHDQYNPQNIDYDFAILLLQDYNDSNVLSSYAKLPAAFAHIPDGTVMTVSGWGITQNTNESMESLRATNVPTINRDLCNSVYSPYGEITERMLCAGLLEGGRDACQGDSGGPLFHNNTLYGVVSWGYGCAKPYYPGVYARVAAVREWIRSVAMV